MSREDPKVHWNIPAALLQAIRVCAEKNRRSVNAEAVLGLEKAFKKFLEKVDKEK